MLEFLVLILVATIITASVESIATLKDYLVLKKWEQCKVSVPFSWLFAIASVLTLRIGITQVVLDVAQVEYVLPKLYSYVDLVFTVCLLAQGSGAIINVLKKFKEIKEFK